MEVEGRMPCAAGDVERALIVDTLRLEADHRSLEYARRVLAQHSRAGD